MSLFYCNKCKRAFLPEKAITDGHDLYCKKCQDLLINLGSEDGRISLKGHIISKEQIQASDLYHDYALIKSKHYQIPKKDPILIDCEAKLKLDPLNIDALYTLSQWYYSQGLIDEAAAINRQIIKIAPDFNKSHEFLSRTMSTASKRSTDLPNDLPTLKEMAINYFETKQFQKAEETLKKILRIDSKHAAARRYLAEIYTETQQFQEAIHQLNRLAMQYPDDEKILFNLAVACFNANDLKRATSNLKEALKLSKDPEFISEIKQFLSHIDKKSS